MNLDINNLGDQDARQLIKSLELVSARVLDAVIKTNQLASSATPEMQTLFMRWAECLGDAVTDAVEKTGEIDPDALAREIGVTPSAIISLALTLHRAGRVKIKKIEAEKGNGENAEICGCLK